MTSRPDPRYFFIIGAMKAGTTSLYKYLADHPELYASPRKEPRIFRDPGDLGRQRANFLALFTGRRDEPWCFEASTAYTKHPRISGVARRIQAAVAEPRFVYLVRNPVERVWSQYVHNLAQGRETQPFERAVTRRPEYLDTSRYYLQLQQYWDVFPTAHVLVQVFEEMVKNPSCTVTAVCEFLGVDSSYRPAKLDVTYNASSDKLAAPGSLRLIRRLRLENSVPWRLRSTLKMRGASLPTKQAVLTPELRARVADSLREDTERFYRTFGRRVASWSDFS